MALGIGAALAGCTQILGGDKEYVLGSGGGATALPASSGVGAGSSSSSGAGGATSSGGGATSSGSDTTTTVASGGGQGGTMAVSSSSASTTSSTSTGGPECAPGTLGALSDDFGGGTIDMTRWGTYRNNGGALTPTGGGLSLTLAGSANGSAGCYSQPPQRSLTAGCGAAVKVSNLQQPGVTAFFQISPDSEHVLVFTQSGRYLNMEMHRPAPAGVQLVGQIDYAAGPHAYWRIGASSDLVLWETSSDGETWVQQAQTRIADLGFSTAGFDINFGISGSSATGSAVRFDDFNVP